jgi:hypothetical protein
MNILLLIILILILAGTFHYSPSWGPYPMGGAGVVLLVVLVLVLTGHI